MHNNRAHNGLLIHKYKHRRLFLLLTRVLWEQCRNNSEAHWNGRWNANNAPCAKHVITYVSAPCNNGGKAARCLFPSPFNFIVTRMNQIFFFLLYNNATLLKLAFSELRHKNITLISLFYSYFFHQCCICVFA